MIEGYDRLPWAREPLPPVEEDAADRAELYAQLRQRRLDLGLSQQVVATRMDTTQSDVSTAERGTLDQGLTRFNRHAGALGVRMELDLVRPGDTFYGGPIHVTPPPAIVPLPVMTPYHESLVRALS